jgi:hypothetical protein
MRSLLRRLDYPDLPTAGAPASSAAEAVPAHDVRWFFETHLPARIRAEPGLCASLGTAYQFVITGDEGGAWVLDPRQGRVAAGQAAASCRVEVSATDLFAIAYGELHPWKAAEQRRLQLSGNVQVRGLEKLMQLLHLSRLGSGSPS